MDCSSEMSDSQERENYVTQIKTQKRITDNAKYNNIAAKCLAIKRSSSFIIYKAQKIRIK